MRNIRPGKTYYWGVSIPREESEDLNVINYVSRRVLDSTITSIKNQFPFFEVEAQKAYRIAFLLENAWYFDAAYEYYLRAAFLDKENLLYKMTVSAFRKEYDME